MLSKDVVLNILATPANGAPGWEERVAERIMAAARNGGVAPEEGPEGDLDEGALAAALEQIDELEKRLDDAHDRIRARVRCLELAVGVKCTPNGCEVDTVKLAGEFEQYVLGVPPLVSVSGGVGGGSD